jgi:RNA polymerase sigma-70 factor (ECF subfamily)
LYLIEIAILPKDGGMNHEENGHHRAWLRAAFERYEGPLVVYAARLVGDFERGRDIAQDAFLRLCRESPEPATDRVAAWLYTVCRNRALDIRKKERRMTALPAELADVATANGCDPALLAERRDEAGLARTILDRLPESQQEVLRLKIEHGLKYREISEITGLSVSNVGYLLHQGLKTLRHELSGERAE